MNYSLTPITETQAASPQEPTETKSAYIEFPPRYACNMKSKFPLYTPITQFQSEANYDNNNNNKTTTNILRLFFPTLVGVSLLLPMTEPSISLNPLHHFSPNL